MLSLFEKRSMDMAGWENHRFGLSKERWNRLQGKRIWITGAGTGYGRCMAIALAAAGAHLFLTGRREQKLRETIQEMRSLEIQTPCEILPADLSSEDEIRQVCERVVRIGPLYGLVHNAAVSSTHGENPLQNSSVQDWDHMFQVNVRAPWLMSREIFPHMLSSSGEVRMLFITSEAGWAFTPGFGPYNISKAALNNLAASLAQEYVTTHPQADIQINSLVAGEAQTEMNPGSQISPFAIVPMALLLLSHLPKGPNGKFFHRDGRSLEFAYAKPYSYALSNSTIGKPLV
jgi:NAD(P)-dependent dehydrogenase (short-subunit alcohol dehydrogenase family)